MVNNNFNAEEVNFKKVLESFKYWPRIFKLFWEINKAYLIIIIILNILSGMLPVANLIATQDLINKVVQGKAAGITAVFFSFGLLLLISFLGDLTLQGKSYFEGLFQNLLTYSINTKIMNKAGKLNLADFENSKIYDMLQRAQSESSYRPFQIFTSTLALISGIVTLISSAAVIFAWKWWIACILILIPALSTVSLLKQGQKEFLVQWKRATEQRKTWYISYLLTKDTTFKEVKLYNLGEYLTNKYKKMFMSFFSQDKQLLKRRTKLTIIFNLLNQITVDSIIAFTVFLAYTGEILIGNLVGYMKAVSLTQSTSQSVLNTMFNMYQNNLYIKQLFEFLDIQPSRIGNNNLKNDEYAPLETVEEIEFKDVSFKYPNSNRYALKNINLKIKAGNNVAIVGENGSGKTTFVKLLTRLYEIDEGEILINGMSITKFDTNILRSKIGVVFQDFIHFELPLRENIGFGDLSLLYQDMKLLQSANRAGIEDLVKGLPNGLDSQLGVWFDNGTQLSGGQWQKVALSRAFLRNADIYILDEPSSALDPLSESEIFRRFFKLTHEKIGIFTSHRFSTVKYASEIFVFDKGEITERGTHEELMELNARYAKLYNIQASPFNKNDINEINKKLSS